MDVCVEHKTNKQRKYTLLKSDKTETISVQRITI